MNKQLFFTITALTFAVFSLEGFENYNQAVQAAQKAAGEKKYAEAGKAYEAARELAANSDQWYLQTFCWAEMLRENKDWGEAEKKMSEILVCEKASPVQKATAQFYLGYYKKLQGKKKEALLEFQKVASCRSSTLEQKACIQSGRILAEEEKFDDALKAFRDVLSAPAPEPLYKAHALLETARIYAVRKEYDTALKYFLDVVSDTAFPANLRAEGMVCAARILAQQKKYDEAFNYYRQLLRMPTHFSSYCSIAYKESVAILQHQQKKYDEALKLLDEAENFTGIPQNQKSWIDDLRFEIYLARGRNELNQKKIEEAKKTLERAVAISGGGSARQAQTAAFQAEIYLVQARQMNSLKKLDEAEAIFKKVLEVKNVPPHSQFTANVELARFWLDRKNFTEAGKYAAAAAAIPKLSPDQQAANNTLFFDLYISQKKYDEAVASAQKTLALTGRIDPNWKAAANAKIALIYFRYKKDLSKAEEYIRKANSIPGTDWGKNEALAKEIQKERSLEEE